MAMPRTALTQPAARLAGLAERDFRWRQLEQRNFPTCSVTHSRQKKLAQEGQRAIASRSGWFKQRWKVSSIGRCWFGMKIGDKPQISPSFAEGKRRHSVPIFSFSLILSANLNLAVEHQRFNGVHLLVGPPG